MKTQYKAIKHPHKRACVVSILWTPRTHHRHCQLHKSRPKRLIHYSVIDVIKGNTFTSNAGVTTEVLSEWNLTFSYVPYGVCTFFTSPVRCTYTRLLGQIVSWWRHQMETFSALLAICARNSPVTGEFPAQRPVMRSFDIFFHLRLNKRLSKQGSGWWFETPSRILWRHCNVIAGNVSSWNITTGSKSRRS